MTMEMVERVARRICANSCLFAECHERPCEDWTLHEDEAAAAIEAMREPTEAMIRAGVDEDCDQADLPRAYSAMIDAALEKPKP